MTRKATLATLSAINQETRTIELTFSSETPVDQYFGVEILSHEPGAIRSKYLDNNAALLWNHDWDAQIGVVESWRVEGGVGHATVRFGKSSFANDKFNDVMDKIVNHVSVGYRIMDMQLDSTRGEPEVWRVTDWLPMEISLVSVPADLSVGVAREASEAQELNPHQLEVIEMKNRIRSAMNSLPRAIRTTMIGEEGGDLPVGGSVPTPTPTPTVTGGASSERAAMVAIMTMGRQHGESDAAEQFIATGKTLEAFRQHLLDKLAARSNAPGNSASIRINSPANLDLSTKDKKNYSLMRLATAAVEGRNFAIAAPFEMECSAAIEQAIGRSAKGIYLPWDIQNDGARHAFDQMNVLSRLQSKTLGTQPGQGGQLVDTEFRPDMFVDLLRNITVMGQLGATYLSGLVGDIEIPRKLTSSAAYWVNEDEEATASGTTYGNFKMDPKSLGCQVPITKRLMKQSSPSIEGLIRSDMATSMALAIDSAALLGRGLATYKEPLGILLQAGTSFVTIAAADQMTWAESKKFETKLITNNALSLSAPKWLMTPTCSEYLALTPKVASTDSVMISEGPTLHGYTKVVSNQMTNSANCRGMLLAQWSEMLIALWGVTDLVFDTTTKVATQGLIIRMFQDMDTAVRQPSAFVKGMTV